MRDEALLLQVQRREAEYPPERHTGQYYGGPSKYAGQLGGGLGETGPSGRFTGEGHRITRAGEETGGKTDKLR